MIPATTVPNKLRVIMAIIKAGTAAISSKLFCKGTNFPFGISNSCPTNDAITAMGT